jgi:hypothetical protein
VTPPHVSRAELFALADERREHVRAFLSWAAWAERSEWSLRMRNRPDIRRAAEAAARFPEPWWGVVVYSCFDSVRGALTVAPEFQHPLAPEHAEAVLETLDLERGSVGGHRIQPAVKGAKRALVSACARADLFHDVLHSSEAFEQRYVSLRAARVPQRGRTTSFDLLLRAGALAVGTTAAASRGRFTRTPPRLQARERGHGSRLLERDHADEGSLSHARPRPMAASSD